MTNTTPNITRLLTRRHLPEGIDDESGDEKDYCEHHKQAITQPLVLGIVGQLGSLLGNALRMNKSSVIKQPTKYKPESEKLPVLCRDQILKQGLSG